MTTFMKRHIVVLSAAVMLVVSLGWTSIAAAQPATRSSRSSSKLIAVHSLKNVSHQSLVTWSLPRSGFALAYRGSSDVGVVRGQSLAYWSAGQRHELLRFHAGGLWNTIRLRYGVTRGLLKQALATATDARIRSPFAHTLTSSQDQVPPVLTVVDDYGTDIAQLAKVAPFAIRYAGASVLAKQFARATISTVSNPFIGGPVKTPAVSGAIVTLIYSSNPARLGVDDHEVTLTLANESSQAGKANATFLGGGRDSVRANGLVAYKANENQIVFRIGHVVAVATSTLRPTDGDWMTLLSALRTP